MNRSLVFDLATGAFIGKREDALFLGPGGTGKSHLAQAIGQAAIQQGYRVLYRETHILLDELADAVADGTRKQYMESVATVPLLIIDDFGMRKLPQTAAEDLLEIIMRRYERASTLLTSNRPVEDWGKLLGDVAAVSAMLDRLLHHGHVLKCGPRSWRTNGDAVPKPLGFIAFAPEWHLKRGGLTPPRPFRPLGRRSGRIPALPYPPPRCRQYKPRRADSRKNVCRNRLRHGINTLVLVRTSAVKTLIITSPKGAELLAKNGVALTSAEVRAIEGEEGKIAPASILKLLRDEFGVKILLHEGGPALFGDFLAHGCVDELFLTVAPQFAGRDAKRQRPGIVAGAEFLPQTAPWLKLLSVKQSASHLYLRYDNSQNRVR